jgi:tRNA A-37 threonylcarbamoyl transferase component Bud32
VRHTFPLCAGHRRTASIHGRIGDHAGGPVRSCTGKTSGDNGGLACGNPVQVPEQKPRRAIVPRKVNLIRKQREAVSEGTDDRGLGVHAMNDRTQGIECSIDGIVFGGQARREQPARPVRVSGTPTTVVPPDAGVSFFLGSRTPAAAAPSTTSPPQSGSLPFLNHEWGIERYAPVRKLSEGAFGVVYEAEDRELLRKVALRLPKRPRLTTEQDAVDFIFEARILAQLDHPGIVPVWDVGRAQDGRCYVVSKHIDGEDLGRRLKRQGRLKPKEAAMLVRQVALALHNAHDQGLVHRDIQPANILLSSSELEDQAYVADFGLALKTEDVQLASQVAGTPAYMSPEQVSGDVSQLDGRSDIFSLGVVFYELLVGERPFRGKSLAKLLKNIRSGTPKSPDRWHRDVPETLSAISMKCLAKRPADRFQTGKQLADALHRWLTLEEKPLRAEVRHQNPGQMVTISSPMRQLLGTFCIIIASLLGAIGCISIYGTIGASQREGRLAFLDWALRTGISAGLMAFLGICALRSRSTSKRQGLVVETDRGSN